jgi:hypothetical protein
MIEYQDYQGMVHSIAWKYHTTTGIEMDDLVGAGHIAFMKAKASYNPDKSKFSTHLYNKMVGEISNLKKQPRNNELTEASSTYGSENSMIREIDFKNSMLRSIGKEGKFIISLIFNSPQEIVDWTASTIKPTMKSIKNYLVGIGWSDRKVRRAFVKIQTALKEEAS